MGLTEIRLKLAAIDQYDPLFVIWDDASSLEHGWVDPTEEKPVAQIVKSIGFMCAVTEHHLVIAVTTDGSNVNGRFQIPIAMIRSVRPVTRKKAKRVSTQSEVQHAQQQ
jgi:hypothetical protein